MQRFGIGEMEMKMAKLLWDREGIGSGAVVKLCAEEFGWKKSTTYTTLKKLCEKGFAQNENTVVSALIPREQVQAYESERFVERAFDGSLPSFLAAFLGGKTITEQEAAELKRLIDEHKEG